MRKTFFGVLCALFACEFTAVRAYAQAATPAAQADDETVMSGSVVSYSGSTLVIRTDSGAYQLFVFDRFTVKPATVTPGTQVRVTSKPREPGVRLATSVTSPGAAGSPDAVPASVRQLENEIQKQSRKYGLGIRGGASMDQELLLIGVHGRLGPFFNKSISFRPNVEFGFGEVTKMFAFNLEGVYNLPWTPANGKWTSYIGLGPSFILSHQDFVRAAEGDKGIDFGDFGYSTGLNIFTGIEFRSGVFFEVKATVYASPHLRFLVGYTF